MSSWNSNGHHRRRERNPHPWPRQRANDVDVDDNDDDDDDDDDDTAQASFSQDQLPATSQDGDQAKGMMCGSSLPSELPAGREGTDDDMAQLQAMAVDDMRNMVAAGIELLPKAVSHIAVGLPRDAEGHEDEASNRIYDC